MKNIRIAPQAGFTLIELMVTVGILAIVAAIAVPTYRGYTQTAYLQECANEVSTLRLAQQEFFLENNAYFPNPAATLNTNANTVAAFVAIEAASGNIYQRSYTTAAAVAAANCTYSITSTAAPDTYSIVATGQNQLSAAETFTKTN